MVRQTEFDLAEFMTDSLSLQVNTSSPTRYIYPHTPDDRYMELAQKDPLDILGERNFGEPTVIPEDIVGTPIQEFYRGANILVTGGTGFIGKILTEKLVRSIPHLRRIYLLIRSKRGVSSQERFNKLLEDRVFLRMKTEVPNYHTKITVVDGDMSEPDLGMSPEDRKMLCDQIHVVFHSAADVRFIEPLRVALTSNVIGSKRMLDLAKEMMNLKSYIHVSTAYSHCVRRVIEENIPKLSLNYKEILRCVDEKTDEELEEETHRIMQGWPNTYTFSKAVCEDMVQEEAEDLPLCVFRPSVVMPTYKEPVRGWTDNLYGPTGLLVGTGHGVIHCFRINSDLSVDCVPVDYVVNCMIAVAWRTAATTSNKKPHVLPVYNFSYTAAKPALCWKAFIEFALTLKENWPFNRAIWYTSFFYSESKLISGMAHYLLHRLPGAFFDKLAMISGGTPRLTKIYQRIESLKDQTNYFSFRIWEFKNNNVMDLWSSLNDEDKNRFYFDVSDVDVKEHFLVSKIGIRYYYLKEKMEDLPAAQRKNTWLYWAHSALKMVCSLAALKLAVITARALPL